MANWVQQVPDYCDRWRKLRKLFQEGKVKSKKPRLVMSSTFEILDQAGKFTS